MCSDCYSDFVNLLTMKLEKLLIGIRNIYKIVILIGNLYANTIIISKCMLGWFSVISSNSNSDL